MTAPHPAAPTGSRATRLLGIATAVGMAWFAGMSLLWTPPSEEQGEAVRLVYIHVPMAILAFVGCGITTVASGMWLKRRSEGWWVLGGAAAEIGLLFTGLTLAVGSIYGRSTWGTYWEWDPRLTSTAFLFVLVVGYLALRRIDGEAGDPQQRGVRSAIVGLLLFPNVVVVHYSVDWWRSLHQKATITRVDPTIQGSMLFALMLGFAVFAMLFAWLLVHRFRLAWIEERLDERSLDDALSERRSEAAVAGGVG
jgi:heme exporter protein C